MIDICAVKAQAASGKAQGRNLVVTPRFLEQVAAELAAARGIAAPKAVH